MNEVKNMIYKEIQKKQKAVDPAKHNMRIVEDNLAEVEAMQQILAMIIDEENRRRRQTDQQMKSKSDRLSATVTTTISI